MAEIDCFAAGRDRSIRQILAGAEAASGARQDEHTYGVVALDLIKRRSDLAVHLDGEAVEPVGPAERQACHAGRQIQLDCFEGHRTLLPPILINRMTGQTIIGNTIFWR